MPRDLAVLACLCFMFPGSGCVKQTTPRSAAIAQAKAEVGVPFETRVPVGGTTATVQWAGSIPLVSVTMNDRSPYWFVLDTGLTGLVLSPKAAGNRYSGRWIAFGDTSGRVRRCPIVEVQSLKVGGAEFVDLEAVVLPLDGLVEQKHGVEVLGVIGIRTFVQCRLTLDLGGDRILIDTRTQGEQSDDVLQLQKHEAGLPAVILSIGDIKQAFTIDTGSDAAVSLQKSVAAKLDMGPPRGTVTKRHFHEVGKYEEHMLNGSLWLGKYEVPNPVIAVGTKSTLIGVPILKAFRVTIDQSSGTVGFAQTGLSSSRESRDTATAPSKPPGHDVNE